MTAVAKTRAGPRRSGRQGVNVAGRLKELESNEEYHGAERIQARLAGLQGESIGDDDSEYIVRPKDGWQGKYPVGKRKEAGPSWLIL